MPFQTGSCSRPRNAAIAGERYRKVEQRFVAAGTIMALPTSPSIAPLLDRTGDALESLRVRVMRLTCMAGLAGIPQVNLPVGTVSGCPAGLSLIGWAGGDEALLDLAVSLARYCGIARP